MERKHKRTFTGTFPMRNVITNREGEDNYQQGRDIGTVVDP